MWIIRPFCVLVILIVYAVIAGCSNPVTNSQEEDIPQYPLHRNITSTIFWVGEPGNEENGYIPNFQSAWDDHWMEHYGGEDDPNNRNGYFPAGFTPNENPFYYALPYNDFAENGERKPSAFQVVYWADEQNWSDLESMCKNRWVRIIKNDKTAYAQWEDVGPFEENDSSYVYGDTQPSNTVNNHAGLDVSPAIRDFLALSDVDVVDWQFVDSREVPDGSWTMIITTSQIDWD